MWKFNNIEFPNGSRFIPTCDFGNVSLDIRDTMTSDSGIISCTVSNLKGQATTTGTLKVTGKDGVVSTTQHPAGLQGLENIQKADFIKGDLKSSDEQQSAYEKPVFLNPLPEGVTLKENQPLLLETKCTPKDDPNLEINWYHNGLPIKTGSRIQATKDFGVVKLEVFQTSAQDEGVYTCKAVNKAGEAVIFTKVNAKGRSELDTAIQHPRGEEGFKAIAEFESKLDLKENGVEEATSQAPKFVKPFEGKSLEEDTTGYFEAMLEPKGDDKMVIEWTKDGKPLQESKSFHDLFAASIAAVGRNLCLLQNRYTAQSDPLIWVGHFGDGKVVC